MMIYGVFRLCLVSVWVLVVVAGLVQLGTSGTWQPIGPWGGTIICLGQAPLAPDVLFAGCGPHLLKTDDAAATWRELPAGATAMMNCIAVAGAGDEAVAAAFYLGLSYPLVSSDGGQSWQQVTDDVFTDNEVHWLCFTSHTLEDRSLVACTSEGLFASEDGLTDWQRMGEGIPTTTTTAFFTCSAPGQARYYFACGQNQGLYRSEDLASGWQELDLPQPELCVKRVAIEWNNRMNVYACGEAGVFRSIDGGSTWETIWQEDTDRVAIASSAPSVIYAAGRFGLAISPDSGASWETRQDGLVIGGYVSGDLVVSSQSPLDAWLAARLGIYRTEDAGASWYPSNQGISAWSVNGIEASDRVPGLIFTDTHGGVFRRTQDTDWQLLGVTGTTIDLNVSWIALDPTEDATVYAWTGFKLIRSTDMGNDGTWQTVFETDCGSKGLAIDPENGNSLYLGTSRRGVIVSRDRGESWEESNSGLALDGNEVWLISIAPSDPNVLWVGLGGMFGASDFYKTTDAAQSWATVATMEHGFRCMAISPDDPDTVYLGGGHGIQRTTNGGVMFSPLSEGLICTNVKDMAIHPRDPAKVYAASGYTAGVEPGFGLYQLDPTGLQWNWIECPELEDVALVKLAIDPWEEDRVVCAFAGKSLHAYQEDAGPPIELSLSTDQSQYVAGETHVARISATNTGGDIDVDLYVAIMLPDGSLFFWPGFSSEMSPGYWMTPMPQGFSISDYVFFDMALPDSLPGGAYTWFAMFYGQGTEDAVSNLASAEWTFLPQRCLCDFCVLEETKSDVPGQCEVQFGVSHLVQSDLCCNHDPGAIWISFDNGASWDAMSLYATEIEGPCHKMLYLSRARLFQSGLRYNYIVDCIPHVGCCISGQIEPDCYN